MIHLRTQIEFRTQVVFICKKTCKNKADICFNPLDFHNLRRDQVIKKCEIKDHKKIRMQVQSYELKRFLLFGSKN